MNPELAILKTTLVVFGCVFGAATVLTLACRGTGWGRNMTVAILVWAIIAAVFLLAPLAGPLVFPVVLLLIAYGAVREYFILNGVYDVAALIAAAGLLVGMAFSAAGGDLGLFRLLPLLSVLVFYPLHALTHSYEGINRTAALRVAGVIYWGWLPMHFILLRQLDGGYGIVVMLGTMIALNDNAAFYVGRLLGRNSPKLAPRISPNKTWIGFAGGFTATVLVALAFGYAVPHLSWLHRLGLGAVVGVAVPGGGLIESAMKRDVGVKDSGFLIPGHGGVMDRFDSFAFCGPIVYYLLRLGTVGLG